MWWCQFIDWLKFDTRPSSLLNFGMAYGFPVVCYGLIFIVGRVAHGVFLQGQSYPNSQPIPWYKLVVRSFWSVFWVDHKQHVRETCAKVCSICMVMPR